MIPDDLISFLASIRQSTSVGDWIQTAILLVLTVTMIYTARGIRLQAKASDFSSYLQIMERLSKAWRAYGDARGNPSAEPRTGSRKEENGSTEPPTRNREEFEFLELMNVLEMACHLYNRRIILPATGEMLRDHLKEVLPKIFGNQECEKMIKSAFSGPDTFFHIRRFARNAGVEGVPQQ